MPTPLFVKRSQVVQTGQLVDAAHPHQPPAFLFPVVGQQGGVAVHQEMGDSIDDEVAPLDAADAHAYDRNAGGHRQGQQARQQNGAAQNDQEVQESQVKVMAKKSLKVGDRRHRRHHDGQAEDPADSERFFREQGPRQLQGCLGNARLRP